MEDHIAKYKQLEKGQSNKNIQIKKPINQEVIENPIENKEVKIEKFDVDETNLKPENDKNSKSRSNSIIKIPNYNGNTTKVTNTNYKTENEELHDPLDKIKKLYNRFITHPEVRKVICPFDDETECCQLCYKIFACMVCLIFTWVIYLIYAYK